MNISYNWLKQYLDFDLDPQQLAAALTSIGLETGSVEEVETIRGGLKGIVIGKRGAMLKEIASRARAEMETLFGIHVNLQCWVKVKEDWRDKLNLIKEYGYEEYKE